MKNILFILPLIILISHCNLDLKNTKKNELYIKKITVLNNNGGRIDWSHSGNNLIACGRVGEDNYFDVWIMTPDGSF